jgi:hypothetical protein
MAVNAVNGPRAVIVVGGFSQQSFKGLAGNIDVAVLLRGFSKKETMRLLCQLPRLRH